MPIYEYLCGKCGHRFEHLARSLSASIPPCPKCGSKHSEKQLSVFNAGKGIPNTCPADSGAVSGCSGGTCHSGTCPFSG